MALDPHHKGALGFLGLGAFQSGQLELSERYIRAALAGHANDPLLLQNLGLILEAQGRLPEALHALTASRDTNSQLPLAHLHRAGVLVKLDRLTEAAEDFTRALALNPKLKDGRVLQQAPHHIQALVQQSKQVHDTLNNQERLKALESLEEKHGAKAMKRARDFVAVLNGEMQRAWDHPLQRPNWQFFPSLEPAPWYDKKEFPWVRAMEAAADSVRNELRAVLREQAGLAPYVAAERHVPEDWRLLSGSTSWSAYHLFKGGKRMNDNCDRCPETVAMLKHIPLVNCPGHAPEAFFSVLKPGTRIPPHVGLANTKLAVHLALVIPPDCSITVGGETRTWTEGRALIFDDSFEHQAENLSDQTRAVLITEVWNPGLTAAERETVQAMIEVGERLQKHWACVARDAVAS